MHYSLPDGLKETPWALCKPLGNTWCRPSLSWDMAASLCCRLAEVEAEGAVGVESVFTLIADHAQWQGRPGHPISPLPRLLLHLLTRACLPRISTWKLYSRCLCFLGPLGVLKLHGKLFLRWLGFIFTRKWDAFTGKLYDQINFF